MKAEEQESIHEEVFEAYSELYKEHVPTWQKMDDKPYQDENGNWTSVYVLQESESKSAISLQIVIQLTVHSSVTSGYA